MIVKIDPKSLYYYMKMFFNVTHIELNETKIKEYYTKKYNRVPNKIWFDDDTTNYNIEFNKIIL